MVNRVQTECASTSIFSLTFLDDKTDDTALAAVLRILQLKSPPALHLEHSHQNRYLACSKRLRLAVLLMSAE